MFLTQVVVLAGCLFLLSFIAFEYFGNRGHLKRMRVLNDKLEDATRALIESRNRQTEATNDCIVAQKAATIAYDQYRLVLVAATEEVKAIWRNPTGPKNLGKKPGGWHEN
jgi:hypothetical protein